MSRVGDALAGALAGLLSGVLLEVLMTRLGLLSTIALLIGTESPIAALVVHHVVAALFGIGFALLLSRRRLGAGETMLWGLAFGALWWLVSALTLLPLVTGAGLNWTLPAAQAQLPSLIAHLLFGATTGLALGTLLRPPSLSRRGLRVFAGTLARGLAAGLAGVPVLGLAVPRWGVLLGLMAGAGFAVLYPRSPDGGGPTLVRGACYGFLLWVAVHLTVAPAMGGRELDWSAAQLRDGYAAFPAFVLAGGVVALVHHWLGAAARLLFAEPAARDDEDEGPGARGLHAALHGAVAGLAGGVLFLATLPAAVAGLDGPGPVPLGSAIALLWAAAVGATFGLGFRRQTHDLASGLGWGVAYGFVWWIVGSLTLLPVLLGGRPEWTAPEVTAAFPALVGHLAHGAVLGTGFYLLQARTSPWWLTRTEVEATRIARHRASLQGAPAVWALVVVIVLTVPLVLAIP